MYANLTARGTRVPGLNKVVFFGLQYFVKEYLINDWNENFFSKSKEKVVHEYSRRIKNYLGKEASTEHIERLHDLGYLPIEIRALPEGARVNLRVPMMTIHNTHPDFYWLSNALETILSDTIWLPCTSATTALMYRELLDGWAEETGGDLNFVPFQGHDFSMRGHGSFESACTSAAGHLLSFAGTDTVPAIDFVEDYYNANSDEELIGASVEATEHSVACAGSSYTGDRGDDFDYFKRMITEVVPTGIVSIVSDTYDFWRVIDPDGGILAELKDIIMNRDGKVVIRPDSGDPVKVVTGWRDDEIIRENGKIYEKPKDWNEGALSIESAREISDVERKGLIECLYEIFGGTVNDKEFIDLDPHIGAIYGDSITLDRADQICARLADKGFSSTNVVFGIGSFTYQGAIGPAAIVTRDTHGFAVKATYAEINGEAKELFKDPITDNGLKKSARGLLRVDKVDGDYVLTDQVSWEEANSGELKPVFRNSELLKDWTFAEVKENLANG